MFPSKDFFSHTRVCMYTHIHTWDYVSRIINPVYEDTLAHSLALPLLPSNLSSRKAQRLIYRLGLAKVIAIFTSKVTHFIGSPPSNWKRNRKEDAAHRVFGISTEISQVIHSVISQTLNNRYSFVLYQPMDYPWLAITSSQQYCCVYIFN